MNACMHACAQPPDEDTDMLPPPPRPPAAAPGQADGKDGGAGGGEDEGEEDGLDIPDAETIRQAKLKRERMRQAHYAPDYIPVSSSMGRLR